MRLTMAGRHISLLDDAISEVLVDLSSPKWDRALHRRIGQVLAARWNEGGADAFEAATHLRRGGLKDEASTYFEIAGDEAWRRADYGRALACFRATVELRSDGPPAAVAQLKLARCLLAAYEPEACRRALESAGQLAEQSALDWLIYSVFYSGISIALALGDDALAEDFLGRLRNYLPSHSHQSDVQELEALLLTRRGDLRAAAGKLAACAERSRQQDNQQGLVSALTALGDLYHLRGNATHARTCFDEALEIARKLDEPIHVGRALSHYGAALARVHKEHDALELLTESLERLSDCQFPDEWIDALLHIATCKAGLGEFAEARRYAADTRVFARQLNSEPFEIRSAFLLAEIDLVEGKNPDAALDEMQRQIQRLGELEGDVCQLVELKVRRARAHQRAQRDDAAELLRDAVKSAEAIGARLWTLAR
jgi:tetratricopeptide (TPR) repeat protein